MERIGFVGIGLMGHGMAKNLLAKGHPLAFKVHRNRDNLADLTAAGGVEVADARALTAASDIIFFCVTGSPQVEENHLRRRAAAPRCARECWSSIANQ